MRITLLFFIILSSLVLSQIQPYEFYCYIKDTKIEVQVNYDSSKGIYSYIYSVYSGTKNTGWIDAIQIDISTKTKHNPKDLDLFDNCRRLSSPISGLNIDYYKRFSEFAIPVGLSTPYSEITCGSSKITDEYGNDIGAYAGLGIPFFLEAGDSVSGLTIQAKFPPGIRDFRIIPDFGRCYKHIPKTEEYWDIGVEGGFTRPKGFGKDEDWYFRGKTIGPIDPVDYQFYNGGGQKPDDVNLFLKYANPQGRETKLKNGESFDLIIYYGDTTIPSTFKAELNGQDITSKFHPVKGVAEVVKFTFPLGRNTLVLSIDGKNQKGNTATDTDRLVFVVE